MIEKTNELRARQEIADRIARAKTNRLAARTKSTRRARRAGLEFL
ncbi:hypothetical protein [Nocardioides silvaticus]|nr:hypothetical protein [Nocardioides silvaticus]